MALDGLMGMGRSSALTKYEGKGDQDLVDEQIDEVILRLLGLEDVFDIDYGTYKTLLKERLAAARMSTSKIPLEEDQLIVEEYKRIKSKTGRFKVKKKKITSKSFSSPIKSTAITLQRKPLLISPTSQIKKEGDIDKIKDDTSNPFIVINKKLDSILNILSEQLKLQKKISDDDKKKKENLKRQKREESLEKGFKIVKDIVQKALKPFQSIFDRIWRFITFVLLGRAFLGLMKWLENPQNQKRIETLVRFLKDWWPSLALAAGLFLTPFGKFVRTTLKMLRFFIPQIVKLMAAHPILTGAAAAGIGAYAAAQMNEQRRREFKKTDPSIVTPKETKETGKTPGVPQLQQEQIFQRGLGGLFSSGGKVPIFGFENGANLGNYFTGQVGKGSGMSVSGFGKDTEAFPVEGGGAAVLQPGETVLQVGARERMIEETGHDPLAFNVGPNANKPKIYNKGLFGNSSGGIIGFNNGGVVGSNNSRKIWNSLPSYSLADSIRDAKQKEIDRQGQTNTNIRMNYRPWWEMLNPFADRRRYRDRLPSHDPSQRNYNMPGYDKNKWIELNRFRTYSTPTKPNPQNPKSKYAPSLPYQKPGVDYPLQLQGGGLFGGLDKFGRSVFENVGGSVGKSRGRETGIPGGGWLGEQLGRREGRKKYEKFTSPFRGGLIKENSGINLSVTAADRQVVAAQPGEYMLPVDFVNRVGVPALDKLVAYFDSNSTPAKLGKRSVNRTIPGPLSRNRGAGTMTLPPIMSGSGSNSIGSGNAQMNNSQVALFNITPPTSIEQRSINAKIYGLG